MKEHLTEKFLFGVVMDVAASINKAAAICYVAGIYAVDISMSLAMVLAFSFSILTIKFSKGSGVPTWSEAISSSLLMIIMPWVFVFVALLASFVI